MKIVNLLKKELKTKWSSRLLVALVVMVLSSVFGSSFLLKREYDLMKREPEGRFQGQKRLANQPFTHIKTVGGSVGQIGIETGSESAVFVKSRGQNWAIMAEKIFVRNDTLFLNLDKQGAQSTYRQSTFNATITIISPSIQSIDADNSYISVYSWLQKSMTVNLSNMSVLETIWPIESLDSCKISLVNASRFTMQNYFKSHIDNDEHRYTIDNERSSLTDILTVEANMKDNCELQLGNVNIKNLKLNATKDNKIELSSETLKALMKK